MNITIFTSNQPRHVALIERLAELGGNCHAVIESSTVSPGSRESFFRKSDVMQAYFKRVLKAQDQVFGTPRFIDGAAVLPVLMGDANDISQTSLESALKSDVYVVFGASYIKGWLADFLVENRAINIHMGLSPWYRGSSCNFWALNDARPEFVGATLHYLSHGLDSGAMIAHARPDPSSTTDPFVFTMEAVKAAQDKLVDLIASGNITNSPGVKQDKSLQLRYTRNRDFTDDVASQFLNNLPDMSEIRSRVDACQAVWSGDLITQLSCPEIPESGRAR